MPSNRFDSRLRTASLIAIGAFAVHQLRYLVASGGDAGSQLAAHGHGYLADLVPLLAGFVLASLAALVVRAAAGRGPESGRAFLRRRSLALAGAIYGVFALQESIEGLLAPGHPVGVDAVLGAGAWVAIPIALVAGTLFAVLERRLIGFERRVAVAARNRVRSRRRPSASIDPAPGHELAPRLTSPLAFGLARRPPPASSLA